MTESKHTPGPWWIKGPSPGLPTNPCDDGGDYAIYANFDDPRFNGKPRIIAEVINKVDWGIEAPAEANAALIASAPDLLAACEAINKAEERVVRENLDSVDKLDEYHAAVEMVIAAIAKARGE